MLYYYVSDDSRAYDGWGGCLSRACTVVPPCVTQGPRGLLGHKEPPAALCDDRQLGQQLRVGVQQGQPEPAVQHVRIRVSHPAQVPHHARGVHAQGRRLEPAERGRWRPLLAAGGDDVGSFHALNFLNFLPGICGFVPCHVVIALVNGVLGLDNCGLCNATVVLNCVEFSTT